MEKKTGKIKETGKKFNCLLGAQLQHGLRMTIFEDIQAISERIRNVAISRILPMTPALQQLWGGHSLRPPDHDNFLWSLILLLMLCKIHFEVLLHHNSNKLKLSEE